MKELFFAIALCLSTSWAISQDLSKVKEFFDSPWLVITEKGVASVLTADGEPQKVENGWGFIANFNTVGKDALPVNVLVQTADGGHLKFSFTSQSGNQYALNTAKTGEYVDKGGEKHLLNMVSPIKKIPDDIAKKCGIPKNLTGRWLGSWFNGGTDDFKNIKFYILDFNGDSCEATARYGGINIEAPVPAKGKLGPFVCNPETKGNCTFTFHDDGVMWGSYSNPEGGRNNGVFKKTSTGVQQ